MVSMINRRNSERMPEKNNWSKRIEEKWVCQEIKLFHGMPIFLDCYVNKYYLVCLVLIKDAK